MTEHETGTTEHADGRLSLLQASDAVGLLSSQEDPGSEEVVEEIVEVEEAEPAGESTVGEEVELQEPAEEPVEVSAPAMHTVHDQNGNSIEVTRDELEKSYSRQSHLTQRFMEVADKKRDLDAAQAETRVERQRYADGLQKMESVLTEQAGKKPDPELARTNPSEYTAQMAEWTESQDRLKVLKDERESTQRKNAEELQSAQTRLVGEEFGRLTEAVPEWSDPAKFKSDGKKLVAHAVTLGFTEEEVGQVHNHRVLMLLNDSMKYHELLANKPELRKKAVKAPILAPGAKPKKAKGSRTAFEDARKQAKASGRTEDAAAAIMALGKSK